MPAPASTSATARASDDPTTASISRSLTMLLNAGEGVEQAQSGGAGLSELMMAGGVNGLGFGADEVGVAGPSRPRAARGASGRSAGEMHGREDDETEEEGNSPEEGKHSEGEVTPFISKVSQILQWPDVAPDRATDLLPP